MIASLRQRMTGSDEELLAFGREFLTELMRLGLVNIGPDNCQH